MTVFAYVNTSKQIGKDHAKVFANVEAAEKWFEERAEVLRSSARY